MPYVMDPTDRDRTRACADAPAAEAAAESPPPRRLPVDDDAAAKEAFCRRLGRALRRARCARGWSQEVLAERADLSVQHVQRLEAAGRRGCFDVKTTSLLALLRAFGVDPHCAVEDLVRHFEALAQPPGDERGHRP